ncbi:tyrosine-type recombinase/integrase [Lysobacter sp. A6]|uniref:Tyrosine-type recombinase/integrase n=1 Tax=Noviluteimonas lactosilytica TaxID=2888523 RepID=A0ABS8JDC3_9GAMM|nr:tyrosine-type recombinase/integrase [Lysobacter lactosilyticus]MCC8361611.1 tyrosine-type recombinase/integrase [Lysobacter lactosilyticus]
MARLSIDKATVRSRLKPRREPYWGAPIARGLFLGFRRTKTGGTWIARVHDDEKRHRYHSVGPVSPGLDYEAARNSALAWKRHIDAGVTLTSIDSVADACREYVQDCEKRRGKAAAHDAELRFKRTVYDAPIGRLALTKITQKRIEDWRDELAKPDCRQPGLSKASLNRTLTSLKAALNYAVTRRYVSAERGIEWGLVKPFKVDNRRDLFLDLAQRRALLASSNGGVRDLIEAVMLTGARAGELTAAKCSQFDARTSSMTFDGKTGKRSVPLSPPAVALFARLARDKSAADNLFVRDDGKPWAPSDWDKLVRDAATAAKLPAGVCLYTLRHSFITEAIGGGLSPLDVARLVGTSLVMIDKHYGHLAQTAARERLSLVNFV